MCLEAILVARFSISSDGLQVCVILRQPQSSGLIDLWQVDGLLPEWPRHIIHGAWSHTAVSLCFGKAERLLD